MCIPSHCNILGLLGAKKGGTDFFVTLDLLISKLIKLLQKLAMW